MVRRYSFVFTPRRHIFITFAPVGWLNRACFLPLMNPWFNFSPVPSFGCRTLKLSCPVVWTSFVHIRHGHFLTRFFYLLAVFPSHFDHSSKVDKILYFGSSSWHLHANPQLFELQCPILLVVGGWSFTLAISDYRLIFFVYYCVCGCQ